MKRINLYTPDGDFIFRYSESSKLVKGLENMIVEYAEKRNNYCITGYDVTLYEDGIELSSYCCTDDCYSNDDFCFVPRAEIPNAIARRLYFGQH